MSGNDTTNAILDNARAALPGVADEVVLLALFNVCDDLNREAIRRAPPEDVDGDPATWLPADEWVPNYQALLSGTLAALYGQPNKPYYNTDFAKFYGDRYESQKISSRAVAAFNVASTNTIHERLLSAVHAQIAGVRPEAVQLEAFKVVSHIRDEAYGMVPLTGADQTMGLWLTQDQYAQSYQAVLHGILAGLYGQTNMAWTNPDQQKVQDELYLRELANVRAKYAIIDPHTNTVHERITYTIRSQIPLITIEAIQMVMFGVINDIRTEVYNKEPLAGSDQSIGSWLTTEEFQQTSRAILYGMLSRIYGQSAAPWYNLDQQNAQYELYKRELALLRSNYSAVEGNVNTTHERVTFTIRAQIPAVSVKAIQLAMFVVVSELRIDAYKLATLDPATGIGSWLTKAQYDASSQAILYGTLSRLFGQAAAPWYNAEQSQAQYALYQQELQWLREHEAGTAAMTDTIPERIIASVRAEVPLVSDATIQLAMFSCIDRLRIEVYRLPPLTGMQIATTSWFTEVQYEQAFLAIQHGTLYRLYGQGGQPWYNNDLYQAQLALYSQELISLRMVLAGAVEATDSIPERVVSTVRAQIQLVRDEAIKLEMFNVINKIRLEAYGADPLKWADTDYTTWLTVPQYEESYLAVLHGTLCGLYGQSNMPWYNLDLYKAQLVLYGLELDLVRNENIEVAGGLDSLIDEVKPHLPGARDEVLWIELRRCVDEFLKTTQVWEEDISLKVKPTSTIYEVAPPSEASIVRLLWVNNSSLLPVRASMLNIPMLVLERAPDVKDTFTVTVSLTLQGSGCCSSCGKSCTTCSCGNSLGFPDWIFNRWHEAFFDGLIGRMMLQPGKPYSGTIVTTGGRIASDPTSYHLKRFRSAMAEARSAARSQNIYAGQRWRFPAFA